MAQVIPFFVEENMSLDPLNLFLGLIFGSIGVGYFIYGKKQQRAVPLIIGVALSLYMFFVSDPLWVGIIGVVLSVIPYFVRF